MSDPTRDQLLGYLLGALEDDEQAEIEEKLAEDAALRRELTVLSRALAPLDATRPRHEPPSDLAARTCRLVWSVVDGAPTAPRPSVWSDLPPARMRPVEPLSVGEVRYRWQDVLVAAGVVVAAGVLLFPAIHGSRVQARLLACQNNLRELGASLADYSQRSGGFFPQVPARGKLAVASAFAPMLAERHLLPEGRALVCPDSPLAELGPPKIPTPAELEATTSPEELRQLQETMGGSYGYTLGYRDGSGFHGTRNLARPHFAIASDAPSRWLPNRQSENHGRHGQNVLFEDGHVRFVVWPRQEALGDDYFLNDDGLVAAGTHRDDSVIGAGATPPAPPADRK